MHKRIDFNNLGGFPVVQETFNWMQDSYRTAIISIAKLFGDKFILFGCEIVGPNVTSGAVVINGELIPFVGGAYSVGDEVIVVETPEAPVTFQDNNTHQVYFTKVARIGSPGGFPFTDLKTIGTLKDFFIAFQALLTAFNTHTHSYDDLADLPVRKLVAEGSVNLGDIDLTDKSFTIPIPDQGTNNYRLSVTIVANDNSFATENDFSWAVYDKQNASFKLTFREYTSQVQNLRCEYMIFK
jgi:hypothetical protein